MMQKNTLIAFVITLVLVAALGVAVVWQQSDSGYSGPKGTFPQMVLPQLAADKTLQLPQAGQYHLLNVFASWCRPCAVEMPVLAELAQNHPKLPIIGMAFQDKPDNTQNFLQQHGNPFQHIVMDEKGVHGVRLGLAGVPETMLINDEGRIIWRYAGVLHKTQIDELIALLPE